MTDNDKAYIDRCNQVTSLCNTFTQVAKRHVRLLKVNTAATIAVTLVILPGLPLALAFGGAATFGILAGIGLTGLAVRSNTESRSKETRATMDSLNVQIDRLKLENKRANSQKPVFSA